MSDENLARGERMHADATAAHEAAQAAEKEIDARLADIAKRTQAISQRRINGQSNEQEAAEFAALKGDSDLLEKMLAEAKKKTKLASDQAVGSYHWYQDAKTAHQREQDHVQYQALLTATEEIEQMYLRAIGQLAKAGKRIGHHTLSQSWRPSDTMHRAFNLGVAPPAGD